MSGTSPVILAMPKSTRKIDSSSATRIMSGLTSKLTRLTGRASITKATFGLDDVYPT